MWLFIRKTKCKILEDEQKVIFFKKSKVWHLRKISIFRKKENSYILEQK